MKKVLHVIPTLKYGGISSVIGNWHDICHGEICHFDYIAFNDGPLKQKLTKDGSKVTILPTIRRKPLLYFYLIFKIFACGDYDAVHVHNSFKNGLILFLAWIFRIRVRVCHSHTSGLEDKTLKLYLPILKWLAVKFSNVYLACGKEAGIFLYGDTECTVINNTINLDKIFNIKSSEEEIINKYKLPINKKIVGHVGRFSDVKNHDFIIDVVSKMSSEYHCVLIGDGPEKPRILKEIAKRNLSNKFTVIASTKEIPELLSVFNFFLLPSKFEGVSMALLEAQASGLHCFVSDMIPFENDVGLGLVSFLSIKNSDKWLDEIDKLKLSKKRVGRLDVESKFDIRGLTNKSLYNRLVRIYD